jgi:hypothetical protein
LSPLSIIEADSVEPSAYLPPWSGCSKLGQISTDFEANLGKSARNIGIDQQDDGKIAPHLVSFITIL